MKVLYFQSSMHVKNHHALINYKNISLHVIDTPDLDRIDLSQYDVVYSPCQPIDVSKYPNTKFIFGPHFSIFPDNRLNLIKSEKTVYNLLSDWVINIWRKSNLCDNLKLVNLPFGVDTERFKDVKPIAERDKVFIYFKTRHPSLLKVIESFLISKRIDYVIFNYDTRYNENVYIEYLKNSKYGIWVGRHESQGFALEEALSCNIPLLVWNVKSMNEEYKSRYENIPATAIPYWDDRCGEYFYDIAELENTFNKFIDNIEKYKPREFILENLSFDVCENRLINFIQNM